MAHFLVTGGGGFIGSNLAHALAARGEQVRVVDNFATGRMENLAELVDAGRVELIRGDICDADVCARAVAGVDYVLHQAAIPSVPRSMEDPVGSDLVNVHGTVVLLDAARRAKVKRVVFAGSSSAYGEKAPGEPKVETMPPDPLSPYAVAKLACEHYLRVFYTGFGLETVTLRYFNVFGPRQDPKSQYAAVIPNFVTAALAGRPATIFGDGEQSRDFCFVENAIEANLLACTAPGAPGEIFNIACGAATSLLEVVDVIASIVGKKIPPRHDPPRAGDIKHSLADIAKARRVLGYTGAISFQDGIERTVAWYRKSQ
jgi:UDP-N-acetylglucosamine/UDP-N-acetyl-alpha-D-glucosaminouronate 4-epimerase